jgi:tetraacyldisaccharide 4'-kinase
MIPLAKAFGMITVARNSLYDHGFFKAERLGAPVISVGNISVGGAGKTPFVIALGNQLAARNIAYDVLSRGYRREKKGTLRLPEIADPLQYGDEPALLQQELQVGIYLANRRVDAGILAESEGVPRLHLLDDGFQHRQLHRDFDIVLLPASDLREKLLPVGRLRESVSSLRRADVVVVPEEFKENIPGYDGTIWKIRRRLVFDGDIADPALAFCGLAKPRQFQDLLIAEGVDARELLPFPDHHIYTERDLAGILDRAKRSGSQLLITTSKDAIKLSRLQLPTEFQRKLRVARLITEIVDADRALDQLLSTLRQRCPAWFAR